MAFTMATTSVAAVPMSSFGTRAPVATVPISSFGTRAPAMITPKRQAIKCMAAGDDNKKKGSSFGEIMAFAGQGPEAINGRLAMLGFVSAVGVEAVSGKDIFDQINGGGGVSLFVGSAVVLTLASLVPLLKGLSIEKASETQPQKFMSSNAEMWNGRFAMLGLIALALTEYAKGGPLV